MTRLADRVALVVGGNGAVGRAVTSRFRAEGAAVVPFDVTDTVEDSDAVLGDATSDVDVAGAATGGMYGLIRELALDRAPRRVRVNAIRPGAIAVQSEGSVRARSYPLGRLVEPDDVASAALYLVSDDAVFVIGQTLTVDGGLTIQSAELRDPEIAW